MYESSESTSEAVHGARARILIFIERYLPAYKAGGALHTLANMIEHLGDEFEFLVVARDRDIGDMVPFAQITHNHWSQVGKAQVLYLAPDQLHLYKLAKLVAMTPHDVLYCNSIFAANFTVKLLLLRLLGLLSRSSIIVAPQGEFSKGALAIKRLKKRLFISAARFTRLYKGAIWHASSDLEEEDIVREFGTAVAIVVAPNLWALPSLDGDKAELQFRQKREKMLKAVFLSRISPKKNLDGLLRVLHEIDLDGAVELDIYGPIDDPAYWNLCLGRLKYMPDNVQVNYRGSINHEDVVPALSGYDLFILLTHGESFGYVVLEALQAGCPVMISDKTPWQDLENHGVGWIVSPDDNVSIERILTEAIYRTASQQTALVAHVQEYARDFLHQDERIEQNRRLFDFNDTAT